MLLLGWGASAQSLTSTCTVDVSPYVTIIQKKDADIAKCYTGYKGLINTINSQKNKNKELVTKIDSLQFYVKYYKHSKHVIGPRIIRRIEQMVAKDE